jgi:hypothetical protein
MIRLKKQTRDQIRQEIESGLRASERWLLDLLADHEEMSGLARQPRADVDRIEEQLAILRQGLAVEVDRRQIAEAIIRRIALGELTARFEVGSVGGIDQVIIEHVPRFELVMGEQLPSDAGACVSCGLTITHDTCDNCGVWLCEACRRGSGGRCPACSRATTSGVKTSG